MFKKECFIFMTIKQIISELLSKKWSLDDLFWLFFMCLILSIFFTPFFGIPMGIVAYFLLFYKDDDFEEMEEKYNYHDDNKK